MSDAIYSPDVVIVGGGVAGLTVALNLAPRRVCVITKSSLGINTSSSWAQGGIAAAVSKDDSNESHINDTLTTAKGLANIDAIKEVVNNAKGIIDDLEGYGVNFDKNEDGSFNLGLEGAHSFNRIIRSKGDSSGLEIMRGLIEKVKKSDHITVLENVSIDRIMTDNNAIYGVIGRFTDDNVPDSNVIIQSSHVVLATGGLGGIFANTTNPRSSYGEGIALASHAGATLTDMEFVQFHPTGLDFGLDPTPLATEAIRGEGAYLVNQDEERFMFGIHPDHELAKKLLPHGRGSMIAFGIKGGKDAGVAFINNVKLASHLANVGDTRTLVIHPASGTHSQMDEATLKFAGLSHDMIRLSVGIEDIDDIKNDFEIGFRAARKPRLVSNQ